jgi:hypothetical protein
MQRPLGLAPAGVQMAPAGHCEGTPIVQGARDTGVWVAMQSPPQGLLGPHVMVGVQVDEGGQSFLVPIVHGCCGGFVVGVGMQSPPQVMVCVQEEPVGHCLGLPRTQGIVYMGPAVVVVGGSAARASGNA